MNVLMPKGFSIDSIEKCMMDGDSNFIEYDDEEAINSRLGSSFIVLKQTHFIAYYDQQQVKCSYNCRNSIMKTLISDNPWVRESFLLERIDGVLCSKNPPYLLFTNECLRGSEAEDGSIIANYTTVDIPSFAEITKSKQCNDKFFIKVKSLTPLPKDPNFTLLDIEGNPVEEHTEYQLEMYDQDMDILNFFDGKLSGTAFENQVEILAVKYSIVDGSARNEKANNFNYSTMRQGKHNEDDAYARTYCYCDAYIA
ncbi:hypothetical protein BC943DRAFT_334494 [Umbelopsis sp. AD052]|nr:hypothetical protein BC943DRAFT_334494 [Umbelopsis sp. AD052]